MTTRESAATTRRNDSGTALLFALVIVTVMALGGAALLSFTQTSMQVTVALRYQAATAYAADGAAQVAISELAGGSFPNSCSTSTGDARTLGTATTAFYTPAQAGAAGLNAYVACTPDTTTGVGLTVSSANKPADALVTVGNDSGVAGQDYSTGAANKTIAIANGNVVSNSSIRTGTDTLAVTGTGVTIKAASVTGCSGIFSPTPCTPNAGTVTIPSYPAPTDPVSTAPAPVCTTIGGVSYAAFRPGWYPNLTYLNGSCGRSAVVWFSPGTYYFDYSGSWTAPARLVGGTPTTPSNVPITGLDPTSAATLGQLSRLNPASPGGCANPSVQSAPGVEFVFGGGSRIDLGSNNLEICATYSATAVPIAIYGPTAAIPVGGGTATKPVSAETVCKTDSCALFTDSIDGQAELHVQGFTYAPNARMSLTLKNSDGQVFNWGLVLRSYSLAVNGASPTGPVIQLPPDSSGGTTTYSIMYLQVYVCPAGAVCTADPNTLQLRAKVRVTGSPASVAVLSWARTR